MRSKEHLLGFLRCRLSKRCWLRSFAAAGHSPPWSPRTNTCTHEEKANASVKSSKSNYTSVRKDVIHINHYKDKWEWNHNSSHLLLINNREEYNQVFWRRYPSQEGPISKCLKHSALKMILPNQDTLSLSHKQLNTTFPKLSSTSTLITPTTYNSSNPSTIGSAQSKLFQTSCSW